MKTADLYESVTRGIVTQLEQGVAPWTKPWKNGKTTGIMPTNAATGRPYNGINIPILWAAADALGYPVSGWMTFKQAQALGATVRQGEKGHHVVFTKKLRFKEPESEEERQIAMLRCYVVFNVAQIDGLKDEVAEELPPEQRQENVEAFIAATNADIRLGGNRACYVPALDFVSVPLKSQFNSLENFFATTLHEVSHWSGHKTRLDRDLAGRFGNHAYAAEELIAELSAAFLCAHLGIVGELRHAEYIGNWITLLKEDNRAVFTAASKASQASDFLRRFSEPEEPEEVAWESAAYGPDIKLSTPVAVF